MLLWELEHILFGLLGEQATHDLHQVCPHECEIIYNRMAAQSAFGFRKIINKINYFHPGS